MSHDDKAQLAAREAAALAHCDTAMRSTRTAGALSGRLAFDERGRRTGGAKADLENCLLLRWLLLCCWSLVGASSSVTPVIAPNRAADAAREICCFRCHACAEPSSRAGALRRTHK